MLELAAEDSSSSLPEVPAVTDLRLTDCRRREAVRFIIKFRVGGGGPLSSVPGPERVTRRLVACCGGSEVVEVVLGAELTLILEDERLL